jgi:DNA/RNA-binding protein KIN17
MNATQWSSLTEFARYLGRESICRVTEDDKGVYIAWIDNSPERMRRQDALKKKEMQDKGDEEREKRDILAQVERAHAQKSLAVEPSRDLERKEGELISLRLSMKDTTKMDTKIGTTKSGTTDTTDRTDTTETTETVDTTKVDMTDTQKTDTETDTDKSKTDNVDTEQSQTVLKEQAPIKMTFASSSKPKNVFASAKKVKSLKEPERKMSEAERIMREEMDRKRKAPNQNGSIKKMKFGF